MTRRKGPDVLTREEILTAYADGVNLQQAAKTLGVSYGRLLAFLRQYDIPAKSKTRNWHRVPERPELANRDWLHHQLITLGKSYSQVAADLGTSRGNVADKAYRLGIKSKASSMSEAAKISIAKRFPEGRHGAQAPNWKGGRREVSHGKAGETDDVYIYIYNPEHPYATKSGYVMEHRLVVEKRIGRYLTPEEVIHHLNGKKDDNRDENLELVPTRGRHVALHFRAIGENASLKAKLAKYEALHGPLPDDQT